MPARVEPLRVKTHYTSIQASPIQALAGSTPLSFRYPLLSRVDDDRLENHLLGTRTSPVEQRVQGHRDGPATLVRLHEGGPPVRATSQQEVGRVVDLAPQRLALDDGRRQPPDDVVGGDQHDGAERGAHAKGEVRAQPGVADLLEQDARLAVQRPHGRRVQVRGHVRLEVGAGGRVRRVRLVRLEIAARVLAPGDLDVDLGAHGDERRWAAGLCRA